MIKKILLALAFLGTSMAHAPDSRIFYIHESIDRLNECALIGYWQVFTEDPAYSNILNYSLTGYFIRKVIERAIKDEKNKEYMAQLTHSLPESVNVQNLGPDTIWGKMSAYITQYKYGFAATAVVAAGIAVYGAYTYFHSCAKALVINPSDVD